MGQMAWLRESPEEIENPQQRDEGVPLTALPIPAWIPPKA